MAVTYLNFKKIKSYCLGEEAVELNRAAAQKRLNALEKEEAAALKSQKEQQEKTDSLRHAIDSFREFNLNAHREAAQTEAQLREENKHYKELLEAQRNNVEFLWRFRSRSAVWQENWIARETDRMRWSVKRPDSKLIQKTNRMLLSNTKETCRKLQAFSMRNG